MASFLLLIKDFEDDARVVYKFGPNEKVMGKIELTKKTKMFNELESVQDSLQSPQFYFNRAAQRLARCFIKEEGNFPNKTTFES
ncbi:hypothetical protein BJV85_000020 [Clostridium acetobutylicum]|uniref:Uncharacterized protein n=1 Tax=Clostridium acetobutylicum (strain ATCC 824 / DSM 792 / JCM 1419 / IAM 19013 / LMG 5710 / NBRC 13948 / NRRL B-527 / VKM B-1787 / 2291 / W) TaxID=272562 RepID=Q97MQ8_CLOAB|nr:MULTISPECIES: hypothetical protein [Clostridium]AAK78118.1 Hypothetical protein, CF-19 family [Clostridium acetobutylicum ATCC 824]ADZ19177.1 conserved hypothetical protein [Clostridium acetobutylicum EA 2018]AEI31072.1 hypothetical protein SMB_G0135 [Clostridium acetobutylicum DSM 1731]AWV81820.1 hypothetical protein DK921_17375 [Clostridium acetobutylicum]MBC2395366.1 hypothetical protein [Clostridium acetobutylicum]